MVHKIIKNILKLNPDMSELAIRNLEMIPCWATVDNEVNKIIEQGQRISLDEVADVLKKTPHVGDYIAKQIISHVEFLDKTGEFSRLVYEGNYCGAIGTRERGPWRYLEKMNGTPLSKKQVKEQIKYISDFIRYNGRLYDLTAYLCH
jgi:hypothetical protein